MSIELNDHGQPRNAGLNQTKRMNRALHELMGFLRGIIADDKINEAESDKLAQWVVANKEVADVWPVYTLVNRLEKIYEDGIADAEEREELADLVRQIVGSQGDSPFEFGPTDLPLTTPEPEVVFDMNDFVLTGRFMFGTRKVCQKEIEIRGGRCGDNVRLQTSYLVIGALTSRDWKFSSFGTKILKAVEYRERCDIAIVSEKQWEKYLMGISSEAAGA